MLEEPTGQGTAGGLWELREAASKKLKPQSFSLKGTANNTREFSPDEPLIRPQPQQISGLQPREALKQRT